MYGLNLHSGFQVESKGRLSGSCVLVRELDHGMLLKCHKLRRENVDIFDICIMIKLIRMLRFRLLTQLSVGIFSRRQF